MTEQIKIKQNIKDNLPYGGLTKIAKKVNKNRFKKVSVSHVKNVCDPNMSSWDPEIISAAQELIMSIQDSVITAQEKMV